MLFLKRFIVDNTRSRVVSFYSLLYTSPLPLYPGFAFRLRSLVAVIPYTVGEPLHVESVEVLVGVEPLHFIFL